MMHCTLLKGTLTVVAVVGKSVSHLFSPHDEYEASRDA